MAGNEIQRSLHLLEPIVKAIAAAFGSNCEVVLHDLSDPEHSIVCIENGHVTGRTVGGPVTDLGLEMIRQGKGNTPIVYRSRAHDGRELRSCSVVLRSRDGDLLGSLCINYDITQMQMAYHALAGLVEMPDQLQENYVSGVSELLNVMIAEAVRAVGKPVSLMQKDDKLRVVQLLEEKDAFRIKRAAETAARVLNVSRVTIYNYLDEIRNNSGSSGVAGG